MTIFNIHKCILNYYTSVKVGSYSIGTLRTGSNSIGTFFLAKIWRVPILSGHPVCFANMGDGQQDTKRYLNHRGT